jgi:hypothetical protein
MGGTSWLYAPQKQRGRCVNYRHVIDSLVRKPQAFRYSQLRDDLLSSPNYQHIWHYVDETLPCHKACRYIVRPLQLAATQQCGSALGRYVLMDDLRCIAIIFSEPKTDTYQKMY